MDKNLYTISTFLKENLHYEGELPFKTTPKAFRKGTNLLVSGGKFEHNYYVTSGIVELTLTSSDGREKIMEFIFPGEFIGEYSFMFPKVSDGYTMTCLTDCRLELIPLKEYKNALKENFWVNKMALYIAAYWLYRRMEREKEMLLSTAEERYINLLQNNAAIIQQISIAKVAKYLGIHPDSLSRIRKNIQLQ
jgi:CRP-like cAMP-binding protein